MHRWSCDLILIESKFFAYWRVLEIFIFITTITAAFAAMTSTAATLFWEKCSTEM